MNIITELISGWKWKEIGKTASKLQSLLDCIEDLDGDTRIDLCITSKSGTTHKMEIHEELPVLKPLFMSDEEIERRRKSYAEKSHKLYEDMIRENTVMKQETVNGEPIFPKPEFPKVVVNEEDIPNMWNRELEKKKVSRPSKKKRYKRTRAEFSSICFRVLELLRLGPIKSESLRSFDGKKDSIIARLRREGYNIVLKDESYFLESGSYVSRYGVNFKPKAPIKYVRRGKVELKAVKDKILFLLHRGRVHHTDLSLIDSNFYNIINKLRKEGNVIISGDGYYELSGGLL